jgi:hypothetical protein
MEILSAETSFSFCFDFCQLPDGRWAGKCFYTPDGVAEYDQRVYVSLEAYAKNETPERFKYEPCQVADEATNKLYYKLTY